MQKRHATIVLSGLVALLFTTLVATAWVGDDIYFTMRTIDNFLHGEGLRWNISERVQVYSHPLWLLVLTPFCWLSGDYYLTPLALSLILSLGFILTVVFCFARDTPTAIVAVVTMLFSKAFLDYAVSGLENPLSYFLLALFYWQAFSWQFSKHVLTTRRVLALFCTASLLITTRFDLGLLIIPVLLVFLGKMLKSAERMVLLRQALLGLLPLLLWLSFALIYYGSFFPNSYYAKTHHGIPSHEIIAQGLTYLRYSWHFDPLTVIVIALGITVPMLTRTPLGVAMGLGISLYLVFIVNIGGDFMGGRYLGAPFAVALLALVMHRHQVWVKHQFSTLLIAIVFLGLQVSDPNLKLLIGVTEPLIKEADYNEYGGVLNERHFFYKNYGLINNFWSYLQDGSLKNIFDLPASYGDGHIVVHPNPGLWGFLSPRGLHIIDKLALGDPLLSHLDAFSKPFWRIGHFERILPEGYVESVKAGTNHFVDPKLGRYYEVVKNITRDELFSWQRWQNTFLQQMGYYEPLLSNYKRYFGEVIPLERLAVRKPMGFYWAAPSNIIIDAGAEKQIVFAKPLTSTHFEVGLDSNDLYEIRFERHGLSLYKTQVGPDKSVTSGMAQYRVVLPTEISPAAIDRVVIRPILGDNVYAIGNFIPLEAGG